MDFVEILETIDRDLGLGLATGNPIPVTRNSCRVVDNILEETPEKESKPYQFREQKFPLAELMYWQQYGITPEILEQGLFPTGFSECNSGWNTIHLYFIRNRTNVRI